MNRVALAFSLSFVLVLVLALGDLAWGTISISVREIWQAFTAPQEGNTIHYVILNFRLPKILTAISAGAGIATAGLMMQSLFRNPLADTSILGVGSGAGLGVAIYTMAFALFPSLTGGGLNNVWGIVIAAFLGAMAVLMLISFASSLMQDVTSVLLVGVMIGFIASALISILQYFSDEETLKGYLLWSFGSVSGTTWRQLHFLLPLVGLALGLTYLLLPKSMNALNIGERYTRSVGINPKHVRLIIILLTSLISGTITAFTGPIAFHGISIEMMASIIAVPHFARIIYGTANNRILLPATMLSGAALMLLCDILTQLPGAQFVLPINAITSLIGAPIVIFIMIRGRKAYTL